MKMKLTVLLAVMFTGYSAFSQLPEDVLKYSWLAPNGTARVQGIGGAIGALGGDITSNYVNPAGLAFFKTSDFVITPGFSLSKNNSNYRGDLKSDQKNFFNLGTTGVVFGFADPASRWNGKAFSVAVSTIANFNSRISYSGKNNFSSYGEQYAAEAASSGLSINDLLNSNSVSIGTRLAAYTYLIDTLTIPGNSGPDLISMAFYNSLKNKTAFLVNQQNNIQTSGGITEIAIGFAATHTDRFYLGGSLGIPIINYTRNSVFTETDATGNTNSNFDHSTLTERSTTQGVGLNLKVGAIYKPVDQLRIGLALHSPTLYGLKDTYYASMTTNTENYVHPNNSTITASSDQTLNLSPEYKYNLTSPWRAILSGAYVINAVEDVKQQRGFISADIEYVNYKSNSYKTADQSGDNSYYQGVNQSIKDYYKSAFNVRLGGEIKFNTIMARLGFSYYGDPYHDTELKAKKMFVSGGLGYRNRGFFADIAYVARINSDVNFPYRLPDKANTFATIQERGGTLSFTFGLKF
jgi:long-subunit fatty acid transport protein